jgi:6,7-dimethyl-8-ribityllumazine synthase
MLPTDHYVLARASFYQDLAERLTKGAVSVLEAAGVSNIDIFDVPGAFELPLAASYLAKGGRYKGVVCLGAVIRGETDHYTYVCAECARGIQAVQLATGVPCGFGVLTVDNMDQALARTDGGRLDQGRKAATAVLVMAKLKEQTSTV